MNNHKKNIVQLTDYIFLASNGDWADAMRAALLDSDIIHIPAGEYKMSEVSVPSHTVIYGDGNSTVIIPLSETVFDVRGSAEDITRLADDMDDFSDTITLKKSLELSRGDLIYLFGQRNCQILEDCGYDWALGRTYAKGFTCFYAEFLKVASVSQDGCTVKADSPTVFPYYRAGNSAEHAPKPPKVEREDYPYMRPATTVQKVKPGENIVIRNMKICGCDSGIAIRGEWLCDCLFEGLTLSSRTDKAPEPKLIFIYICNSLGVRVKNCTFTIPVRPPVRSDYVWADYWIYDTARIFGCDYSGFEGCESDYSTHAFEIGKTDKQGASHSCYVRNCRATGAIWSGAFIMGGCYNTEVAGNEFCCSGQGIVICGRKNTVRNNKIDLAISPLTDYYYVRPRDGGTAGIAMIEGYAIDSVIENNHVSRAVTAYLFRDGYEDDNRFDTGEITLRNNEADNCVCAVMVYRNIANVGAKNFKLNVVGNSFRGGDANSEFAGKYTYLIDSEECGVSFDNNYISGFEQQTVLLPPERRCGKKSNKIFQ